MSSPVVYCAAFTCSLQEGEGAAVYAAAGDESGAHQPAASALNEPGSPVAMEIQTQITIPIELCLSYKPFSSFGALEKGVDGWICGCSKL